MIHFSAANLFIRLDEKHFANSCMILRSPDSGFNRISNLGNWGGHRIVRHLLGFE